MNEERTPAASPRAVLLDLLMATMDSMSAWALAAGDRELGLRWRDAVTRRMIAAGRYTPYEGLVTDAAAALGLDGEAPNRLWAAWAHMRPWPDTAVLHGLAMPYAFVTNCSSSLAGLAVAAAGLRPAFTLSAEEAGWYKPRSEAYHLACARLGVEPEATRFVAGAPYDARGAADAGLDAVLVNRRPEAPPPGHTRLVASLGEALSRA